MQQLYTCRKYGAMAFGVITTGWKYVAFLDSTEG